MVEVGLYGYDGQDRRDGRLPGIEEVAAAVQVKGDRDLAIPSLGGDQQVSVPTPAAAVVWHREVDFELPGGAGDRIGALFALPVLPGQDLGGRATLLLQETLEMNLSFRVGRGIEPSLDLGAETRIAECEREPPRETFQLPGVR
jgi:hypothetical protein